MGGKIMNNKIMNFFEIGVILMVLFALVNHGLATTESSLQEENLGLSDAEFEWVPVYGDGSHTIVGNEIVLHEVPQLVRLEIHVSDWSPNLLKTLQTTVDSAGYSNGIGGNLVPLGWPGSPEDGCFIDTSKPNYVFTGMSAIDAVHTGDLDYMWGATLLFGSKADDDQTYYLGTLILNVPSNGEGDYLIDFISGSSNTFMKDDMDQFILPLTLTPAVITIDDSSNDPPNPPSIPSGPISGVVGVSYSYSTSTTDPDGDYIRYGWDWDGDNIVDEYSSLMSSGSIDTRSHTWSSAGIYNVKVKAEDEHDAVSGFSTPLTVTITNQPPNKPSTPSGKTNGKAGEIYQYSSSTTDPDDDHVSYFFDWGDGSDSGWTDPISSGEIIVESHIWNEQGDYQVKVKARDTYFSESEWSDPLVVSMLKSKTFEPQELFMDGNIGLMIVIGEFIEGETTFSGHFSFMIFIGIVDGEFEFYTVRDEEMLLDKSLIRFDILTTSKIIIVILAE